MSKRLKLKHMSVKDISVVAVLIAVAVCLRFISIPIGDIIKISFGFLSIALISTIYGPIVGGVSACISDVIGSFLIPSGVYFPGFTLSAGVGGIIYGLFLYKGKTTFLRIFLAVLCVGIAVNILLNSLWLTILYGYGFLGLLPVRILKNAITIPINSCMLYAFLRILKKYIIKFFR